MVKFASNWKHHKFGRACVLFGDQLGAHKDVQAVEECMKCNAYPFLFPPNASHFIQPLDDVVLGLFKRTIRIKALEHRFQLAKVESETIAAMHAIAYNAEAASFQERPIKRAFKQCGIATFDPD